MPEFPRAEMEEMVSRWLATNAEARAYKKFPDTVAVKGQRHGRQEKAILESQLLLMTGCQLALQLGVLIQAPLHHLGQHQGRVLMVAGERQHRGQIVLVAALDAVARAAGGHLGQVRAAAHQEKFPREHVIHRLGRRGAAVDADLANMPFAHGASITWSFESNGPRKRPRIQSRS